MEGDAADKLHVVVHHLPFDFVSAHFDFFAAEPAGCVLDRRERFGQEGVERFAVCVALFELFGFSLELFVGELLVLLFDCVDFCDYRARLFIEFFVVAACEKFEDFC